MAENLGYYSQGPWQCWLGAPLKGVNRQPDGLSTRFAVSCRCLKDQFKLEKKMNYKKSIIGSSIAFVLATSCCWLPALLIALGGGSTLIGLSNDLERYSGFFMVVGVLFLIYGVYQFRSKNTQPGKKEVILFSILTCPECGHQKEEKMPTDACQYFYECEHCKKVLKPAGNDCCVFCSYGTVVCPPIQLNQDCC